MLIRNRGGGAIDLFEQEERSCSSYEAHEQQLIALTREFYL